MNGTSTSFGQCHVPQWIPDVTDGPCRFSSSDWLMTSSLQGEVCPEAFHLGEVKEGMKKCTKWSLMVFRVAGLSKMSLFTRAQTSSLGAMKWVHRPWSAMTVFGVRKGTPATFPWSCVVGVVIRKSKTLNVQHQAEFQRKSSKAMNAPIPADIYLCWGFVANYSSIVLHFHKGGSMKSEWWRSSYIVIVDAFIFRVSFLLLRLSAYLQHVPTWCPFATQAYLQHFPTWCPFVTPSLGHGRSALSWIFLYLPLAGPSDKPAGMILQRDHLMGFDQWIH